MQLAGLYEQWKKSVVPTQRQLDAVLEGDAPFGTPSEHVATMKDTEAFSKLLRGDDRAPPASDSKIKVPGSNEIHLPEKYQHLKEVIEAIVADQEENNPLFKHSAMFFTFRQTIGTQRPPRRVHIDPPRTNNSVDKDQIYFISDKETTLTQSELVKDPADTLNRLKPEIMIEQGFLNRAAPYELRKGTEDTYHVQGADTYTDGRTFMRMIVSHPECGYFHDLSDEEKAELPEDFRMKLGIVFEDNGLTIAQRLIFHHLLLRTHTKIIRCFFNSRLAVSNRKYQKRYKLTIEIIMIVQAFAFYLFAGILILSALMVITARNPVHSVLFLILSFFTSAGLFVLLGAEFIAMIMVIVYVGAVAVLFLFVVMMLDINFANLRQGAMHYVPLGIIIGIILLFELVTLYTYWQFAPNVTENIALASENLNVTNTHALGLVIYTDYVFAFQMAGLVLFIAMVGAIVLTHRTRPGVRKQKISDQQARKPEDVLEIKKVTSGTGI